MRPGLRLALVIVASLGVAVVLSSLSLLVAGVSPWAAMMEAGHGIFADRASLARALQDLAPLILTALATSICFRCGVLNIGGEGQFLLGALAMAAVTTTWHPPCPGWMAVLLGLLAGTLSGAAWGLIASALERWRGVPEVLSTILLNFIALALLGWLVEGHFRDPATTAPQTAMMPRDTWIPVLIPFTRFHLGIPLVVALTVVTLIWQRRTLMGFEMGAVGLNPDAAQVAGIKVPSRRLQAMAIGAGLAGLAGALQTAGVVHFLSGHTHSYGYLGVAVALLGRLHPIGILFAALFFSLLDGGARSVEKSLGVPHDIADLIKGVVVLCTLVGAAWAARLPARQFGKAAT